MPLEQGKITGASINASSPIATPTPKASKVFNEPPVFVETGSRASTPTLSTSHIVSQLEGEEESNQLIGTVSSMTSPSHLSSPPSSLPSSNRNQSRHTYGPSENASGSSFIPLRTRDETLRPERRNEEAKVSANIAEESENEEEGMIGRYKVERILGVGAFSRVVLASESSEREKAGGSGGLVALKMLEREPCKQNERMRVSWVREVEVLKVRLQHRRERKRTPEETLIPDTIITFHNSTLSIRTSSAFFLPFQHQSITIWYWNRSQAENCLNCCQRIIPS
jgi:hypothetical protein